MKGVLLTLDGCKPCDDMKEEFKDLLSSGEVEEVNFQKDPDRVIELMEKHDISKIPSLLILSDSNEFLLGV